jgi:hypothetical protein
MWPSLDDGPGMTQPQRTATRLLLLVCILLLNCAAQPLLKLAQLDQALSCQALTSTDETGQSQESPQPSSCELKGKWLSATQLNAAELIFFVVALIIAVLPPLWRYSPPLPPPRNGRAPKLRLHLQLCVLRE